MKKIYKCKNCNKILFRKRKTGLCVFCAKRQKHSEEHNRKVSEAQKGKMPKNLKLLHSLPRTKEWKEKIGKANLGKTSYWKGKKLPKETCIKISNSLKGKINLKTRGENNPAWKGGISKHKSYRSFIERRRKIRKINNGGSHAFGEWETLKAQYNWTCPCCHKSEPEIKLSEDHIIPLNKGGSDNIENIQPLCVSCNCKKNTKIIKYAV